MWAINLEQGKAVLSRWGWGYKIHKTKSGLQLQKQPLPPVILTSLMGDILKSIFASLFFKWNNPKTIAIDSSYLYVHIFPVYFIKVAN